MSESTPPIEELQCSICHGKKSEHGPGSGVRHAFTLNSGELKTHQEAAREQAQAQGGMGAQVVRLGGTQTNEAQAVGRLLEVLLQKGIVDVHEALYIAAGTRTTKDAQFLDPAAMMGATTDPSHRVRGNLG